MAINTARASLVQAEYRYTSRSNAALKARYPSAQDVTIETNLDASAAEALADLLWPLVNSAATSFKVPVETTIWPEDWLTAPPRFTVSFPEHPAAGQAGARTFTVTGSGTRFSDDQSYLVVRG